MQMGFKTFIRSGILVASLLGLSACWESGPSLILPANSVNPLPMGTYNYYTGSFDDPSPVKLITFPGGGYIYIDEDGDAMPLLVHRIDDDWHILQVGNDSGNLYAIARRVGKRIEIYDPDCDEHVDNIPGLSRELGTCKFATLDALVEATRLAMKRIETGEESQPGSWFEPDDYEPLDDE